MSTLDQRGAIQMTTESDKTTGSHVRDIDSRRAPRRDMQSWPRLRSHSDLLQQPDTNDQPQEQTLLPSHPAIRGNAEEAVSHLMGAAVGWIVLLTMMLPCTYLIGAGYISLTKGGTMFAMTAVMVASSAATVTAGATGVDGLVRATAGIFSAISGVVSHFIRQPTSLAPWAITLLIMVVLNTATNETRPSSTEPPHAIQRPSDTSIVAMASDQGIFELVTPGEACVCYSRRSACFTEGHAFWC